MLDSRIPLMAQGLNLEPRSNALMRLTQLQGAQQGNALRQMQVQQLQQAMAAEAEQRKAEAARQQQLQEALRMIPNPRLAPLGGNAAPTPANAAKLGNDPRLESLYALMQAGQVKPTEYINEAFPVQKVARTVEVDDGKGGKATVQLDERGNMVGQKLPGYIAPVQVNQGNQVTFARPQAGVSLPVGMSPSERDASARGWANVNIARQQAAEGGKPPAGYRWKQDGTLEAIPGGPADQKATAEGQKAEARKSLAASNAANVLDIVNEARNMVGLTTTGVGGLAAKLPMTEARDLKGKLDTIKANLGFDRLQAMREASPTGGALGQVAVQELQSLQATVASLDQLQSPGQLRQALDRIDRHYTNWAKAAGVELPKKPTLDSKAIMTEADRIIGIGR